MTTPQAGRIFISYRRADSAGQAGRIYDRLAPHFGKNAIFMDVDTIQAGLDFIDVLENAVQSCDVVVALLGRQWLNIKDEAGKRRLDDPQDFVRIEVATALSRGIRVIPVLIEGTPMPNAAQLPSNLKSLARRNAIPLNHQSFHADADRLIEQLELALKAAEDAKDKAEAERIYKQKTEEEWAAKAKLEDERLAKKQAEAEQKEKKKAEEDQIAKAKLEANRLAEEKRISDEAEKQRLAKFESDKFVSKKAEEDRIAKAKLEADRLAEEKRRTDESEKQRLAKLDADKLISQKAEDERIAKAKLEADRLAEEKRRTDESEKQRLAKLETEKLAAKKTGEERIAKVQAEAERKKKEKAISTEVLPVEMKAKTVSAAPQKKSILSGRVVGVVAVVGVVVLAIAGLGINAMLNNATPSDAPAVTEAPFVSNPATITEAPVVVTRNGGWLDQINFSVVSSDFAITQLQAGAIDVYGTSLSPSNYPAIKDAGLNYSTSYGTFYSILYNPTVFKGNNTLNPFSNRKIREATNWLYDREYINREIYANASLPKFITINTYGPEYISLADTVRNLEERYAYNPDKARQIISDEMITLGAELGVDGKWQFKGKPVTLIFIIRNDSDGTRIPLGDYIADQLESAGFTVDRQYKKSSEASPIWSRSDPEEGEWNLYTEAWNTTQISRDESFNFGFFYTDLGGCCGLSSNYMTAENISQDFYDISQKLWNTEFSTISERGELFKKALDLSLLDSFHVWLIDYQKYTPYNKNVQVASDLGGGLEGSQAWPFTIRFLDEEGGTLNWAASDLFSDPWNPVAGSNWTWDRSAIHATQSGGVMADPTNGLAWPLLIEKAEVTVKTGLAVQSSLDWVTLNTTNSIDVPSDAWVDWDPSTQTFMTAGSGQTAKVKSVVYYPSDLFQTVKWHDGSSLSIGDLVMSIIMIFDPAKPESAIYDETNQPKFEAFMATFKGIKIVSTDPLIIEYYTDAINLDAELNVYSMWPMYGYGEAGWHVIAVANMAESNGELAYSVEKADSTQGEWMNLLGGASLEILNGHLNNAADENLIPYSPTMSQFVTAEEASIRYSNIKAWYATHNHFWIGTGPYYLDRVFITDKTLTLKHFTEYPDLAGRWDFLIK